MVDKAILYDPTLCTACRGCQVACKQWNENDEGEGEKTENWGSYENPRDLSPSTWLKMAFIETEQNGKLSWLFNRRSCMHCTDAACVRVCPNGTLYHNEYGIVAYNKDTCIGCGYCVEACPFNVPRLTKNILTGIAKMDKCSFCTTPGLNRIAEGWEPACVKTCPPKALIFGDRDKLVAEGRNRVAALKTKGFASANLYGDSELGGLHVLYVLADSTRVYQLPENPQVSIATTAWQSIQPLGWAVGGITVLGLGLNYLVARQQKIAQEKQCAKEKSDAK